MKVLAFSCYYTPEIAASMYLTEDIYKGIVDDGHELEVFVPTPTRGVDKETRNEYKKRKIETKYDGKLIIHRVSMIKENENSLLRAIRYLLINIVFIWKGLFSDADVIFVQSTPPTQGMMAAIISKLKKIPFIYNLQDIFPDSLINTGIAQKDGLLWKIGRKIEDFSYRNAKKIIVLSEDFKKNIMDKGVTENKIVVAPNWADVSGVYPIPREKNVLVERYNLDASKIYISYSGNIGYTQNMDLLLEAAKRLMIDSPNVVFLIIGDGADKDRVKKRVETENIKNVIMIPFQPYDDIAHVFSIGDIGLIISKPGVGNNSVPSKTWGIMAVGKPVLASFDKDSELAKLIDVGECGLVSSAGDIEEFIKCVKELTSDADKRKKMGLNSEKYLKTNLSKDQQLRKYLDTIIEVGVTD